MNWYSTLIMHRNNLNEHEARNRHLHLLRAQPQHRAGKRARRQQPS